MCNNKGTWCVIMLVNGGPSFTFITWGESEGALLSIPSLAHTLYKAYEKIHGSITGGVCAPGISVAQLMKSGVSAGKARGSTPSRSPIRRCMPSWCSATKTHIVNSQYMGGVQCCHELRHATCMLLIWWVKGKLNCFHMQSICDDEWLF